MPVDNINRYDSLRFDFTSAVRLTQLNIGWMGSDSDITVLAYTGAGVAPLAGLGYASLIGSGWTLVNHYSNPGTGLREHQRRRDQLALLADWRLQSDGRQRAHLGGLHGRRGEAPDADG